MATLWLKKDRPTKSWRFSYRLDVLVIWFYFSANASWFTSFYPDFGLVELFAFVMVVGVAAQ